MDLQGLLGQVDAGSKDDGAVQQAVQEHVASMSGGDLSQHLQTAADSAGVSGKPDIARDIQDLVTQAESDPEALKADAVTYITHNPQVLEHFAPAFAQGILGKL